MDLKQKVKNIPKKPGVYFFKNKIDKIIYIGKAKILRNRVASYFNKSNVDFKSKVMISKAFDVDYLVVNDEVEAMITEANMIKEYKPKYNVFLKDDKSFPYIVITNEPFPKVEIIRKKNLHKDGNIYFGPYTDVNYLREVVKVLHRIFPIRTCSYCIDKKSIKDKKVQLCLDYYIKKCEGPCEGLVSEKKYSKMISLVQDFLKGKNKHIVRTIRKSMDKASSEMNYEDAARFRDQLIALDAFVERQKKITRKFDNQDVLHVSSENNYSIGFVMRIRNGLLIGREKFDVQINNESTSALFYGFLIQYYNNTLDIPDEIILDVVLENKQEFENWLSLKKNSLVKIINPLRGEKRKILDLCIKNSDILLKEKLIRKIKRKDYIPKVLIELQDVLSMSVLPKRIEAFDNSNLQGTSSVAGMVCFIDGKPVKKEYRRFNIKTVKGIDDFESMREVVYRRYSRQIDEGNPLPDLILIDGGKGQLSAAKSSLDKLGLGYIAIIGLAKKLEEIFVPGNIEPQNISKTSPALYFLRKIRDEVHRYAITFHKKKRNENLFDSIFKGVNGLGDLRIKKIWKVYNSVNQLKKDSVESIYKKTKIPKKIIIDIKNKI
ncbi:MAG: excinuclease ABC subunit C [Candidatus Marinimicrobia bacterium]|nr:excinuclease ABC subunit C [Candidatus Neomarinimicrobiota bacterium]